MLTFLKVGQTWTELPSKFLQLSGLGQILVWPTKGNEPNMPHGPAASTGWGDFFIFIFFFVFLQIYFFVFKIYRNIPRPPRCRATRTWSPRCGAAGAFVQKLLRKYLRAGPWGPPGRPAVGWPALAARLQGDRLSHPYIRVGWSPHPSFASLKFQKPRKKREGGREAKPCQIFEPATAGNQNSSTLYK